MGLRRVKKVRIGESGWHVGVYTFGDGMRLPKRTFAVFVTINGRVFTQKVYGVPPQVNRAGGWPWLEVQCLNSSGDPPDARLYGRGCGGTIAIKQWASDQLMKVVPSPD